MVITKACSFYDIAPTALLVEVFRNNPCEVILVLNIGRRDSGFRQREQSYVEKSPHLYRFSQWQGCY